MSYQIKTRPTGQAVVEHIQSFPQPKKVQAGLQLLTIYREVTKLEPVLWGSGIGNGIIGFGEYQYKTKSNCTGTFMQAGFALRKANIVVYIMGGFKQYQDLLQKMGQTKHSVSCLYLTKFDTIDLTLLQQLIATDFAKMQQKYPDINTVYQIH